MDTMLEVSKPLPSVVDNLLEALSASSVPPTRTDRRQTVGTSDVLYGDCHDSMKAFFEVVSFFQFC